MLQIPFIPENAPFSSEQRTWLNGFLAGLFSSSQTGVPASAPANEPAPATPLLILFGSQTGTAEGLARKAAQKARSKGFVPAVRSADEFEPLPSASHLLLITSTYGDGEPPDNAAGFWKFLSSAEAPRLEQLRYSVLALGDRNYPAFCKFGGDCDARLEALGALRAHPRTDCDVDGGAAAMAWMDAALQALQPAAMPSSEATPPGEACSPGAEKAHSRTRPFPARLLTNRLLNAEESDREVRHFELQLEGSGLAYEVGDALGVFPSNCHELVADVLGFLACDGEEPAPGDPATPLRLALLRNFDLVKPSQELLALIAQQSQSSLLPDLLRPEQAQRLREFLHGRDLRDLLSLSPSGWTADTLVPLLKKLQPRLYSISSSPHAHPGEVHLTVAAVRYEAHGLGRKGVCSTFLADRAGADVPVPVFVQISHGFRLPPDPGTPIIMVGPGTGVAPFRAFLEERQALGAPGRNWLFFGAQHQNTDFLYREELDAWKSSGHLTRLSLAFSRDQAEKIYVQQRMREEGAELWKWLQEGAHFYVCGDASRMAKDVEAALQQIMETHGALSEEAASAYLRELRAQKRYQRDVY